jgi:hypothetical protein
MRHRLSFLASVLFVISGPHWAFGKDNPFPQQILAAKTIVVISHYGFTPSALDPVKGLKFRNDAEEVLRDSGRFTLLEDPAKSDLVLLLVGGYSPGRFGFKEHIVTGAIFLGGAQPSWTPVPLWIWEQTPTLRTHSASSAVTKEFLKDVKQAEQRTAGSPAGNDRDKSAHDIKSQGNQNEGAIPLSEDAETQSLPREILQAKKVMVVLRVDAVAGPQGEKKEKNVEKEIRKWGRFSLVNNPDEADLVIVCIRFLDLWQSSHTPVYENLFVFKGGTGNPDWKRIPLWTAMQIDATFGPSPGTQMVRWLRRQMERQETLTIRPAPVPPQP